ncbi:tyrosine-type recombinase/integrase [Rosistilla oblonga]|uniref:Site-specific tyrosine recombinase XerC n=1 Tax=Rosistilla oblonga TaxID=2527990 RepID=A0A518IQV9_9BACT|nr:tyrosine-type recombinase/integrase [Rosistilla oblonga]QDV55475.1 site-specific tyrosine recombinase XerC [Rosistilla oblonga]
MRKPFFRKQTQAWYVKDDQGRFIRLGKSRKEAFAEWKAMLTTPGSSGSDVLFISLCDDFLVEHEPLLSPLRFADHCRLCQSLVTHLGTGSLAKDVTPGRVTTWLREPKPGKIRKDGTAAEPKVWSTARQKDAVAVVRRVMNWAVQTDRLKKSPVESLETPAAGNREGVIDPNTHRRLVQAAMASDKSRSFACYLIASHCGARPQQIRDITAGHCESDFTHATFTQHKTAKSTGKPLTVYFAPCLQTLLRILAASRPEGRLFRNDHGRPWVKDTVCQRFRRLREQLGLPSDIVPYLYRHTFATDSIRAGQSEAITAALLGHKSSKMVQRIYSHMHRHDNELIEAAAKASAKRLGG